MKKIYYWLHIVSIISSVLALIALSISSTDAHAANAEKVYSGLLTSFLDVRAADYNLNAAYKELMNRLPENEKNELKQSQRNWLKARNAELESGKEINAIRPTILNMINARTEELRAYRRSGLRSPDGPASNAGPVSNLNRFGGKRPGDVLGDKEVGKAIKELVGNYYDQLVDNLGASDGVSINSAGALTVSGIAPHLGTLEEAIIYIDKSGGIYIGILSGGEKVLYFTNVGKDCNKPILPISEFIKRFPRVQVTNMCG